MTLCLIRGAEGDDVAASGAASRPRFAEGKSMVTAFRPSASRNKKQARKASVPKVERFHFIQKSY